MLAIGGTFSVVRATCYEMCIFYIHTTKIITIVDLFTFQAFFLKKVAKFARTINRAYSYIKLNRVFQFKNFSIDDSHCGMKIGTDGVMLGSWAFEGYTPSHILDVGAGSGLISLMMAQRFETAAITGIELDEDAYEDATKNIAQSKWHSCINILNGDFLLMDGFDKYDAIVSNPPFYDETVLPQNEKRNIARHETSLDITGLIFKGAKLLKSDGHIALIAPSSRTDEIIYILTLNHLDPIRITHIKHNCVSPPMRVMIEAVKGIADRYQKSTIVIKDLNNYTKQYKQLTDMFYLESTFKD